MRLLTLCVLGTGPLHSEVTMGNASMSLPQVYARRGQPYEHVLLDSVVSLGILVHV